MDSPLAILRLFSVLVVFLALVMSLFTGQVGAAAAQGAADAAAVAVTDTLLPDWDCTPAGLPADAEAIAAQAVVDRTAQLAAVQPTAVEVHAEGSCSVIVSVQVSARGWLGARDIQAVACRRPPSAEGAALRGPVAPPC